MDKIIEDARIISQERICGQIYRLRLHSPEIAGAARCGQFVMIRVREGTDPLLRRPFSFTIFLILLTTTNVSAMMSTAFRGFAIKWMLLLLRRPIASRRFRT